MAPAAPRVEPRPARVRPPRPRRALARWRSRPARL